MIRRAAGGDDGDVAHVDLVLGVHFGEFLGEDVRVDAFERRLFDGDAALGTLMTMMACSCALPTMVSASKLRIS